jgi:hypothetical protein
VNVTTNTTNLIWISGVVGFFLPHLIAVVNQAHWQTGLKSVVAFSMCLVAAVIVAWVKGDLDFHNWVASAGVIFTAAQVSYKGLWRPTGTSPAIEASTTPSAKPRK